MFDNMFIPKARPKAKWKVGQGTLKEPWRQKQINVLHVYNIKSVLSDKYNKCGDKSCLQ